MDSSFTEETLKINARPFSQKRNPGDAVMTPPSTQPRSAGARTPLPGAQSSRVGFRGQTTTLPQTSPSAGTEKKEAFADGVIKGLFLYRRAPATQFSDHVLFTAPSTLGQVKAEAKRRRS